ncbi:MAG: Tim44-like domain-containing protein [Desulfobacterota bacterium]|nr:Tim44-like domain-containing protein [Thermodesulfobacteriota bacterium]
MSQRKAVYAVIMIFVFSLFYAWIEQAEARRMGGGRSFGSSPGYQRSAPSPTSPQKSPSQPGQAAPAAPAAAPRPFGGMLGGLLMGGLIGSLLFGGMHSWGGPGLLDILLIGGVLFFVYRFIKARRMATQEAGQAAFSTGLGSQENWGSSSSAGYGPAQGMPMSAEAEEVKIPKDFDQQDFMKGAKAVYTRLQSSWDKRDIEDIRQFTSKEVWAEINRQAQEDPQPSKTEILRVNARLLEVASSNSHTVAAVLFDVMMRESREEDAAKEVREIWHFSKDDKDPKSFWVLEGIQQVE